MNEMNVDPAEIEKFSTQAAHWWDINGQFKLLHEINPLRLEYIHQCAPLAGKKVIDVGCGGGILTESMAKLGSKVTGIDMSEAALKVAQLHQIESQLEIDYRQITPEDMAAESEGQYDVVTCLEMLEHVPDPASIIQGCAKLAKPGGQIFFSTLNRNIKAYLFAIIGAEYVLKLLPRHTHDYAKFIKPSELVLWCQQAELSAKQMKGLHYNPFTKHYKLNDDVSINYIVHCQR